MVLGDDLHGIVVFQYGDLFVSPHRLHQSALYLETGVIGVVENTKLAVPALAMEVEITVLVLVEVHPPAHQIVDGGGGVAYNMLHSLAV